MAVEAMLASKEPIPLRALKTQVGGHFVILEIDAEWVCKPVLAQETLFYENLPVELKKFTPKYKGVISIGFSHGSNGEYQLKAYPSERTAKNKREHLNTAQMENESCLKCSLQSMESKGAIKIVTSTDIDRGISSPLTDFRIQEMRSILESRLDESKRHDYIIIENLTGKFKQPCVMDLKLGTRTYSDNMSEEKKQAHLEMCDATTSKSLGIRLGGMQLYHSSEQRYYFMDKYYGHALDRDALFQVMTDFLYNGNRYRLELLPQLIEKLRELREVIRHLDSYRLFSSSLLIMYEGEDPLGSGSGRTVVQNEFHSCPMVVMHPSDNHSKDTLTEDNLHNCTSLNCSFGGHDVLDVKMIDFQNFSSDEAKYDGPDEGYLLGLTNIINTYEAFLDSKSSP